MVVVDTYFPVPTLTKMNSHEDDGIVLNVKETEEQTREIKKESGLDHTEKCVEEQVEQCNEPSTSSGSACPKVKHAFFLLFCAPPLPSEGKAHLFLSSGNSIFVSLPLPKYNTFVLLLSQRRFFRL